MIVARFGRFYTFIIIHIPVDQAISLNIMIIPTQTLWWVLIPQYIVLFFNNLIV